MKHTNWREIVEIIGVISIVASLLVVATELRQSNRIAVTDVRLQIANNDNRGHFERASNAEFAKLFAKLENPESHLITATEQQQIKGLARHYMSNAIAVQVAYDQGFLTDQQFDGRVYDFGIIMENLPGLVPEFIVLYDSRSHVQDFAIFSAIEQARLESRANNQ